MEDNTNRRRAARIEERAAKRQRTRTILIIAGIVLALVLAIAVGALAWYTLVKKPAYERYQFDTDALQGRIQTMTEEEIQAELNRVVEEGMFNISIASSIVFDWETREGQARIENIAANRYHMQVDITLDETQKTVYSSKLIQPGYSIEMIQLNQELEPGVYPATAIFSALTKEEMELVGQAGAQIHLYIMDENGRIPAPTPSPEPTLAP